MTRVIAHRGASGRELENTLAAFRAAVELGADGVELDVHVTSDSRLVVHHDDVLAGKLIRHATLDELRAQPLGNGELVPTLDDVLEELGDAVDVFIEVKELPAEHDGTLLSVLDSGPAYERYRVHSFDHRIVRRLRDARPSLPCGVLSASYPLDPIAQVRDAMATSLWQEQSLIERDLVELAHNKSIEVCAWTVNDDERMRALVELGVDAICTNYPDVARKVCRR
ncbi:MAG: glycerophosphodiester phosphodiesterase [Gemmatimonadales bacterium]